MIKRKVIPMLTLIGLSLACLSARAEISEEKSDDGVYVPVVLKESTPVTDPNYPRTPVLIPVGCYFDCVSSNLCFSFISPMGPVTITLTEASAGIISSDEYPTNLGFITVPIPSSGSYEINILLESGAKYTGQFIY